MKNEEREMVKNCASALANICMELGAESAETTIIKDKIVYNVEIAIEIEEINA